MVRDYERDVTDQVPNLMAVEKIGEAMVESRNQDCYTVTRSGRSYPPLHLELLGYRRKMRSELIRIDSKAGQVPLYAHEEQVGLRIPVLVRVQDVAIVAVDEVRDAGHPLPIGAGDEQDSGISLARCVRHSVWLVHSGFATGCRG